MLALIDTYKTCNKQPHNACSFHKHMEHSQNWSYTGPYSNTQYISNIEKPNDKFFDHSAPNLKINKKVVNKKKINCVYKVRTLLLNNLWVKKEFGIEKNTLNWIITKYDISKLE